MLLKWPYLVNGIVKGIINKLGTYGEIQGLYLEPSGSLIRLLQVLKINFEVGEFSLNFRRFQGASWRVEAVCLKQELA